MKCSYSGIFFIRFGCLPWLVVTIPKNNQHLSYIWSDVFYPATDLMCFPNVFYWLICCDLPEVLSGNSWSIHQKQKNKVDEGISVVHETISWYETQRFWVAEMIRWAPSFISDSFTGPQHLPMATPSAPGVPPSCCTDGNERRGKTRGYSAHPLKPDRHLFLCSPLAPYFVSSCLKVKLTRKFDKQHLIITTSYFLPWIEIRFGPFNIYPALK